MGFLTDFIVAAVACNDCKIHLPKSIESPSLSVCMLDGIT